MKKELLKEGGVYTNGKGIIRKITKIKSADDELIYETIKGRNHEMNMKERYIFISSFANWAKEEVINTPS